MFSAKNQRLHEPTSPPTSFVKLPKLALGLSEKLQLSLTQPHRRKENDNAVDGQDFWQCTTEGQDGNTAQLCTSINSAKHVHDLRLA